MTIKLPITVNEITFESSDTLREKCLFRGKCGDMVAVKPCDEEYQGKTFLGVMLGEIALSQMCRFNDESGELTISKAHQNPAMFVPEINAVIYGCGSWWSLIENVEQLRNITDEDIENVWYVKALRQLEASQ